MDELNEITTTLARRIFIQMRLAAACTVRDPEHEVDWTVDYRPNSRGGSAGILWRMASDATYGTLFKPYTKSKRVAVVSMKNFAAEFNEQRMAMIEELRRRDLVKQAFDVGHKFCEHNDNNSELLEQKHQENKWGMEDDMTADDAKHWLEFIAAQVPNER